MTNNKDAWMSKYFLVVFPPSTGGQAGIFAVVAGNVSSNCIDPFRMTEQKLFF
jgi:hypothetical protein